MSAASTGRTNDYDIINDAMIREGKKAQKALRLYEDRLRDSGRIVKDGKIYVPPVRTSSGVRFGYWRPL